MQITLNENIRHSQKRHKSMVLKKKISIFHVENFKGFRLRRRICAKIKNDNYVNLLHALLQEEYVHFDKMIDRNFSHCDIFYRQVDQLEWKDAKYWRWPMVCSAHLKERPLYTYILAVEVCRLIDLVYVKKYMTINLVITFTSYSVK